MPTKPTSSKTLTTKPSSPKPLKTVGGLTSKPDNSGGPPQPNSRPTGGDDKPDP